jgi:DNA-binding CsgD family transcriptional regulator
MAEVLGELLDSSRLLFYLQQANEIAQCFGGCLDSKHISVVTTDGLVERFNAAFARIWLVEPDGASLRLVASSGLYTRIDGSFSRVPMGAYKVGKIALNRVSFLSNNLSEEAWVKDRNWAIANQIRGFAGFPLIAGDRTIGVLAAFSYDALTPEFLEVLQVFCTTIAVALDSALKYQSQVKQASTESDHRWDKVPLSDQMAAMLNPARLTLIGTEKALSLAHSQVFMQLCEILNKTECRQCRLTYGTKEILLEAITIVSDLDLQEQEAWLRSQLGLVSLMVAYLGGQIQSQLGIDRKALHITLSLPYSTERGPILGTAEKKETTLLSERERGILGLLAQGLRDRDIANRLILSESTVKFHLNNVLAKLKARTRYQALYLATIRGLLATP